jgi:hypothetical protein
MIRSLDYLIYQEHNTDEMNSKLEALADFQLCALNHALACKNLYNYV